MSTRRITLGEQLKRLYIEPCAGLGNRMLALASAYRISYENQSKLTIIWKKEGPCYVSFSRLFQPLPSANRVIEIVEMPLKQQPVQTVWGNLLKYYCRQGTYFISSERVDSLCQQSSSKGGLQLFPQLAHEMKGHKAVYIKATRELCELKTEDFRFLKPSKDVEERGYHIWSQINPNTIGVHIRRTDHSASIEKSKTEDFIRVMDEIIRSDPNVRFYIASDDDGVLQQMIHYYGRRCICYQSRTADRQSETGMIDAAVELYALSKCNKILGSYSSTFSKMAALIGGIENQVITS